MGLELDSYSLSRLISPDFHSSLENFLHITFCSSNSRFAFVEHAYWAFGTSGGGYVAG